MKFAKRYLLAFMLLLAAALLVACKEDPVEEENTAPVFAGVAGTTVFVDTEFDPLEGVSATDAEDGDVTSSIQVTANTVDTHYLGDYVVSYSVADSEGLVTTATRAVEVVSDAEHVALANYLSGIELQQLLPEAKGSIFAALEQYLLENVYAGVPLYTGAARVVYSDRVQLYSETFNGVMGYGAAFSQFTADDSSVKMLGDTYGNAGEYTWRASYQTEPSTFNPWTADDSNSDDFITLYTGGLYEFYFDSTKTSYEINPSLASAEPIPVDGYELNGRTYASVWQIPIRDDLEWAFNSGTDLAPLEALNADYEVLDAEDWLWTWKEGLTNNWFRAISGGGDFISMGVVGAADYAAGNADWEDVGLSIVDGNTLQIEYISDQSTFDVKYSFAGNSKPALQPELFQTLGESGYGLGPDSVAASGVYVFDTYDNGLITFVKNELSPDADFYHYTGRQYRYVSDSNVAFAEFEAGRLDSASVPADRLDDYLDNPNVYVSPQATTWRLVINSFGTEENRDAYIAEYPEIGLSEDFVPEPILQYTEMRQALYYGIDRQSATDDVPVYLPAWTYYNYLYFLDAESALGVRGYDEGQATSDMFGGASAGYFPDLANDAFVSAVGQALADGFYADAAPTAADYYEIEIQIVWASSGSVNAQTIVATWVSQLESVLVDDEHFFRVVFDVQDVQFPNNYYDYMMTANTDLGIGGISGSLLDAPDFMDVFRDDNYGGFTLDWGIDTHTPNITVTYENLEGNEVTELWSFNALVNALNRKTYVKEGAIQEAWDVAEDLIDAYLDIQGTTAVSAGEDTEDIATYVKGDLEELAVDLGYDSIASYVVETESGVPYLFILGVDGDNFELVEQLALITDAPASIKAGLDSYGASFTVTNPVNLDDAGVVANAYISANYGYATVAEAAEDNGAPAAYAEVWAIDWSYSGGSGSDAVILLHIGDYYIFWTWL